MSESFSLNQKLTVGIHLSDPSVQFALSKVLSPYCDVTPTLDFQAAQRRFVLPSLLPHVVISDFNYFLNDPNLKFQEIATSVSSPKLIAFLPTHAGAQYFFRLQRLGVSVCLWKDGFDPVAKTIGVIGSGANKNSTDAFYDAKTESYLRSCVAEPSLNLQERILAPRIHFSDDELMLELSVTEEQLLRIREDLYNRLEVSNDDDAIATLLEMGIEQFPMVELALERKKIESQTLSLISKWMSNEIETRKSGKPILPA